MLKINKLSKSFEDKDVFSKLNLNLKQGDICLVKGDSGIGKTTLFRCISGLEEYEGNIKFKGPIAYVFQDNRFMPWLTIEENLLLPLKLKGVDMYKNSSVNLLIVADLVKYCTMLDILVHLDKYPSQVSGGELQRLSLVQALLTSPNILLLDEPLNQLDKQTYESSLKIILDIINENKITTLIVSHIPLKSHNINKTFSL